MRWTLPVDEVLTMKSADAICHRSEGYPLAGVTVADELTMDDIDDDFHQRIMKVMARERINLVPVLIVNDVFFNGHRRVLIAEELGLDEVLCTDDWFDSGWYNEEEVIGE